MPSAPKTDDFSKALLGVAIVFSLLAGLVALGLSLTDDGPKPGPKPLGKLELAPAFRAADLAAQPGESWATNGGSLSNQRYSPLDEITTDNVGGLKGVWMTHLKGSALAAKYSAEAQPLVYKGTAYVSTGADDVFAVDIESGRIRWQHKGHLDQQITSVCCGWANRGVAVGDGLVYIGRLDGKLEALDQRTGRRVWSTEIESWRDGYTITSAPLYYDGRVYTGISGGEFQARGRVTAVDAKTGRIDWRFFTTPGPGEVGHETWPQNSDAWKRGGAPVWQTPAVDPELGLLYFSTGNASPDDDGHVRPGDNLFSASIVAIDARTGKYRWHFQQVHHDIWDYDGPSPVVLLDVRVDGQARHAIAEANKTGWLYMLDRETGKPIHPIVERKVPQNRWQRTSRTQPFPTTRPVVPQEVSDKQYRELVALARKSPETKKLTPQRGPIFHPLERGTLTVVAPSPAGGNNWPPASYNPKTGMVYVCQLGTSGGYSVGVTERPKDPGSKSYLASTWTLTGFTQNPGTLAAIEASTGRIAWQTHWKDSCYSGSTTTGGNLVFVGRNNGELQALDARTGDEKWSFQTGAGANNTPTVFEQGGRERVLFYAGGNGLAATQHGDNLWLFGLDGEKGPAKAGGGGQGVQHAGENTAKPELKAGDAGRGQDVFAQNCSSCHGAKAEGGNGGPNLLAIPDAKKADRVLEQVQKGGGGMPSFEGTLTPQQIADVTAYVLKVTRGRK